jgi:uncharacterized repeat protein (TIGR03803 family)
MRSKCGSVLRSAFRALHVVVALVFLLLASAVFAQTVKTVVNFNGANGANPQNVTLTQGRDGRLYGTTENGGAHGVGMIFRFDPSTNNITVLHSFNSSDGADPRGGVTLGSDNNFYGATIGGGSFGHGVLYKTTVNGNYTVLHEFTAGSDGFYAWDPPIEARDGNFYGVAGALGGHTGTIYRLTQNGTFSIINSFEGGSVPGLAQGSDGKLYLTFELLGCGVLDKVALYGGVLSTYLFPCTLAGPGVLTQAGDGNFYGTSNLGGTFAVGAIFQLTPVFGVTTLYNFESVPGDGIVPNRTLVLGSDGNLYGTTGAYSINLGNYGAPALYQWSLASGYRLLMNSFPSSVLLLSGLMQHTNGLFYGVTTTGGTHNDGFLFSLDMGLTPFVALVRPHGVVGSNAQILGQGLIGTSSVTFNGIAATSFNVVSDTYMTAVVPSGATNGPIVVTTPTHTLTSNQNFTVP